MLVADSTAFAARLVELRERAGLTKYRLAQVSGVSKQTLSQLEQGKTDPSWETVRRLARALKVDVSEFDVGDLDMPPTGDRDEPEQPPPAPPKKPKK